MAGERVLILEDDPLLQTVLAERFGHEGWEVFTGGTIAEARSVLEAKEPDVALVDLRLPDGESVELLREAGPSVPTVFVVMTAHATVGSAVEALKLGARDYLEKPFSLERAVATVRQALEVTALRREVAAMREGSLHAGTTVIGEGPAMRTVFELIERLAAADTATVIIEGESGTGKGAIAQALHRLSRRASGPFINVTCAALPETLMESELFGHEKGAFTDAHTAKRGLVELADGGTLFLDEIGELTPGVQAKLLRFIEEKTYRRLGGTRDLTVNARIMAATNRDLATEVAAGRFRPDLYYRLRVMPITMPPLRERREDIPLLAKHFATHFATEFAKRITSISPEGLEMLAAYDWPGNVRELRNVMERAVLLADREEITVRELPPEVARPGATLAGGAVTGAAAGVPAGGTLEAVERKLLVDALEKAQGNQSKAAQLLGISRHQIRTRMQRYGLLGALLALALTAPSVLGAQAGRGASALACARCHSSKEFLVGAAPRTFVHDSLVVRPATLDSSAHRGILCVRCHPRAEQFPHVAEAGIAAPCESCHAAADSTWRAGVHHFATGDSARARCVECHGSHRIVPVARLAHLAGAATMNGACVRCHADMAPAPGDVHADSVACIQCHGAHAMRPVRDPATNGLAVGIARACASCHPREAREYWEDAHGALAARQAAGEAPLGRDTAATCMDCHWGHAVRVPQDRRAHFAFADACIRCHPRYGATFRESYHGQATRVGSERAALCADCHTAHSVYPTANPASSVSAARRTAMCRQCHAEATARFAGYLPHADPRDRARFPGLYALWLAMTILVVVVTLIYIAHAVLVSRRTVLERRRRS